MYKFSFVILALIILFSSCKEESKTSKANNGLLAMVMQNDQYGYINTSGKFVIKPQYPLARTFSNGLACINIGGKRNVPFIKGVAGGKYHFINTKNEIQFNGFFSTSPMTFYNNVAVLINDNGSKELMNKEGKIVAKGFTVLGDCEDNLIQAVIEGDKKLGFLNPKGEWAIELPFKYFVSPFSEQLSAFDDNDTKLSGYLDTKGDIKIAAKYTSANNFSDGLARVKLNSRFFFINKKGEKAFEAEFESAGDFKEGLCAVQKNGQWGFINKQGEIAISYQILLGVREMSEGLIAFKEESKKVGYMNEKGKIIIPAKFDNGLSFKNGYAIIEKNGKMGFIDKTGKMVIAAVYTRAGNFANPIESNKIMQVN